MTSPTEGLPAVDKALAVARGLVAFNPAAADQQFEFTLIEHEPENAGIPPGWRRYIHPDGSDWYVFNSGEGWGSSATELPPGERVVATLRALGTKPLIGWLRQRTAELERGEVPAGRPLSDDDLERLHAAIAASAPDHPQSWLAARQARDSDVTALLGSFSAGHAPAEDWLGELEMLRTRYGADGVVTGTLRTAVAVVQVVLAACHPDAFAQTSGRYWSEFHSPFRTGDPAAILETLASRAINDGGAGVLLDLVEHLRSAADERSAAALASPTLDQHLEALYETVPLLFGALALTHILLSAGPEHIGDRASRRLTRVERMVDENLVRAGHAFDTQVTDLEGAVWRGHRAEIAAVRAERGEAAAEEAAQRLVDEHWFYPRALLPLLVAREASPAEGVAPG